MTSATRARVTRPLTATFAATLVVAAALITADPASSRSVLRPARLTVAINDVSYHLIRGVHADSVSCSAAYRAIRRG